MQVLIEAIPCVWRVLLLAGAAVALIWFILRHERAIQPIKKVSREGIVDFELARTPAMARWILCLWGPQGRDAARQALHIDSGVLVSYSVLLCLATSGLASISSQYTAEWVVTLGWWFAGLSLVAGMLDAFENWALLRVLRSYSQDRGSGVGIRWGDTVSAWLAALTKFAIVIAATLYVLAMLAVLFLGSRAYARLSV